MGGTLPLDRSGNYHLDPNVCGHCGVAMAGPGTCAPCIEKERDRTLTRALPGTRKARRRAFGISRSRQGR